MLQTRLENEQFDPLLNSHRSRNGIITLDRPDSSQRVDLHVYIIPKSVWRHGQHSVENEAMEDAVSAGFVRVPPDMYLHDLREPIEQLCGTEDFFPREFIFLRSVGRCLTRVKARQENELKVKNYRPPQTPASEIYLLEGRHEDYVQMPSASPALSSSNYLFGNRRPHRSSFDGYSQPPTPIGAKKELQSRLDTNPLLPHSPSSDRNSGAQAARNHSIPEGLPTGKLSKLKEEQERLCRRQDELERMRREVEEKQAQSAKEEKDRSDRKAVEEDEKRRRRRRQEKAEAEKQRTLEREQAAAATKIQASFRGFKDRQAMRDRKRNMVIDDSRPTSSKATKINTKALDFDDDDLSDGEISCRSSSIKSASSLDSDASRPETRTIQRENGLEADSSASSLRSRRAARKNSSPLSTKKAKKLLLPSSIKHLSDDENARSATVTKGRHVDGKSLPKSTPEISDEESLTDDESDLEQQRAIAAKQIRQSRSNARRKANESKSQQLSDDPELLRLQLQGLRTQRLDSEKHCTELVKRLKITHLKISQGRKEARDLWKKKYYKEKKKSSPLEGQVTALKADLEAQRQRILQTIENQSNHSKESETPVRKQSILEATRTRYEIDGVRDRVEQAQLRLAAEMKLRNQAENECQSLKNELNQAQMHLNHMANRA